MPYNMISIPSGSTRFEDAPTIQVIGNSNSDVALSIKYHASENTGGRPLVFGLIVFSNVLEYCWQADYVEYEELSEHEDDFEFGLIEILRSSYIENMAAKGVKAQFSGHRFGEGINDAEVKHYRLAFDDYGRFDVIALSVSVSEIHEDS